jgi:hypothetical protein
VNIQQAKELVKANPKHVGGFIRAKINGKIANIKTVNWMLYSFNSSTGQTFPAASIGDGKLYGVRVKNGVLVPNLDIVVYENPLQNDVFEMSC